MWKIKKQNYNEVLLKYEESGEIWSVPIDENNRHYREYLEWVSEGNEPEVIEDVTTDETQ